MQGAIGDVVLRDFDGTLAVRDGRWAGAVREALAPQEQRAGNAAHHPSAPARWNDSGAAGGR